MGWKLRRAAGGVSTALVIVWIMLACVFWAFGQTAGPKPLVDVEELKRIIEIARESGFSEEQVREITIEDEAGNLINALDYLKALEREKQLKASASEELKNKRYLTVQEIFADLKGSEQKDLKALREKYLIGE